MQRGKKKKKKQKLEQEEERKKILGWEGLWALTNKKEERKRRSGDERD